MRAVVQRVKKAEVRVGGRRAGAIDSGLLVYLGVEKEDTKDDLEYISSKISSLRIFEDETGKMNRDVTESGGVLVVSQFTLLGDTRKGRRPSFDRAEAPERARALYGEFIEGLRAKGISVEAGEFQAHMEVDSVNDGPVTLILDSRKVF